MRTERRVSISAFVDPDNHERLVEQARWEERSVSADLRVAIRQHLRRADDETRRSDEMGIREARAAAAASGMGTQIESASATQAAPTSKAGR